MSYQEHITSETYQRSVDPMEVYQRKIDAIVAQLPKRELAEQHIPLRAPLDLDQAITAGSPDDFCSIRIYRPKDPVAARFAVLSEIMRELGTVSVSVSSQVIHMAQVLFERVLQYMQQQIHAAGSSISPTVCEGAGQCGDEASLRRNVPVHLTIIEYGNGISEIPLRVIRPQRTIEDNVQKERRITRSNKSKLVTLLEAVSIALEWILDGTQVNDERGYSRRAQNLTKTPEPRYQFPNVVYR